MYKHCKDVKNIGVFFLKKFIDLLMKVVSSFRFEGIMSWRARFSPTVATISVWLNPKDPNCFGVRNWWRTNLPEIQMLNPYTNFSIQEISFGEPHMHIAYSPIDQRMVRLAGATEEECEDIMEACVTYGANHAILEKGRGDGGDVSTQPLITSFGYCESFTSKLEVIPPAEIGQRFAEGVDDPGQKPRVYPRNTAFKIVP